MAQNWFYLLSTQVQNVKKICSKKVQRKEWGMRVGILTWNVAVDQEISPRAMRHRHGQWYIINLPWTMVYIGYRMRILQK